MSDISLAYLILAHQHPEQVARLVDQLRSPAADMFLHIDAKTDIAPFLGVAGSDVHFTAKRVPVYWADYSQVSAILLLIEAVLAASRRYDYLVLLSGSDYPLRSTVEIENFFKENNGLEFIDSVAIPSPLRAKPLSRLTQYQRRPGLAGWLVGASRRVLVELGIVSRERDYKTRLGGLAPYGGGTWWALTREACDYVLKFAIRNPKFMKFFENTSSPDEMVFQTILENSPFRSNIRRGISYVDWSQGGSSPATITERHVARFRANPIVKREGPEEDGECLFCRKVVDAAISDQLAAMIRERSSPA
jgi:hypothetical protein